MATQQVTIVQSQLALLNSIHNKCVLAREQSRKLNNKEWFDKFDILAAAAEDEYHRLAAIK